jgi:hypothetical protein
VTILLIKLYGWVGWAMAEAGSLKPSFRDMRAVSTGFRTEWKGMQVYNFQNYEQVISRSIVVVVVIRSRYLKGKVRRQDSARVARTAAQTGKLAQVWSCLHLHVSLQVSEPLTSCRSPLQSPHLSIRDGGEARSASAVSD